MNSFRKALKFTLPQENGYVNDPDDPGGETYYGITRRDHTSWEGWKMIDSLMKTESLMNNPDLMTLVEEFYENNYWNKLGLNQFPAPVAIALFDSAVHCGRRRTSKWLQEAVVDQGYVLIVDGIIGLKTMVEALKCNYWQLTFKVLSRRLDRYYDLRKTTVGIKNKDGWNKRVADLMDLVGS